MITNTKIAWKWRSKCKEKERIVDLGPNNEQLTYLHFFVRSFVGSFVRTFVRLFVCTFVHLFVHSLILCSFVCIVWLTRPLAANNTKRLLYRTLARLRLRTRRTRNAACRRRLHIPRIVARSLARLVARAHTAHTRRSSHMPRIEQMQCQMLKLQQIWIKYLLY